MGDTDMTPRCIPKGGDDPQDALSVDLEMLEYFPQKSPITGLVCLYIKDFV